jgi:hypothetical protein
MATPTSGHVESAPVRAGASRPGEATARPDRVPSPVGTRRAPPTGPSPVPSSPTPPAAQGSDGRPRHRPAPRTTASWQSSRIVRLSGPPDTPRHASAPPRAPSQAPLIQLGHETDAAEPRWTGAALDDHGCGRASTRWPQEGEKAFEEELPVAELDRPVLSASCPANHPFRVRRVTPVRWTLSVHALATRMPGKGPDPTEAVILQAEPRSEER